jgi:hypothetical protein
MSHYNGPAIRASVDVAQFDAATPGLTRQLRGEHEWKITMAVFRGRSHGIR